MSYQVQTCFYDNKWENIWKADDVPESFDSLNEAIDAIRDHIIDCINAVESGYMEGNPAQESFRIVSGDTIYEWTGQGWEYDIAGNEPCIRAALQVMIDNDFDSLRAAVATEALNSGYNSIAAFFSDLQQHGCQSGMVGSLIYYHDTHTFYDKHYDEIEQLRHELEEALGESLQPKGDLKNWFAWMAFEETAHKIAEVILPFSILYNERDAQTS